MTRRAGCQKATTELSLHNLQSLSHLRYPTDTRQLTSSQGEADGVSDRIMMLQALGGGEFALRLVPHQRAAPFYRRTRTHTLYVGIEICMQTFFKLKSTAKNKKNSFWFHVHNRNFACQPRRLDFFRTPSVSDFVKHHVHQN